jgi:hypothetical protein
MALPDTGIPASPVLLAGVGSRAITRSFTYPPLPPFLRVSIAFDLQISAIFGNFGIPWQFS